MTSLEPIHHENINAVKRTLTLSTLTRNHEPTEGGKRVNEEVLVHQVLEQAGATARNLDEEDEEQEQR